MKPIITAEQAKAIDSYSIEELGMSGLVLMERAALRFVEHITTCITPSSSKILAVCGSGNNGGDGMAIIRILADKGYSCTVYLAGDTQKMTESTRFQWEILKKLSIPIVSEFRPEEDTVIIDALFGIGLSRKITGYYAKLIQKMNQFRCFSVDLPSGLNADNGQGMTIIETEEDEIAVKAEITVTFGFAKSGLFLGNGRQYAGKVFSEDIGFPKRAIEQICHYNQDSFDWKTDDKGNNGWYLEESDLSMLLPRRREDSHKGNYGKLLVFAGSETMLGAAYYVGKAAYRMGAGLVEIVTCRQNIPALAVMLPAAIYTPVEDLFFEIQKGKEKFWTNDEVLLEQKLKTATAVVLGPGLGILERTEYITGLILSLCSKKKKPLILDADGLNILANHISWQEFLTESMILTPHLKEMSRLCKKKTLEIKRDMITTAREFAKQNHKSTLILKDSRSVITNGNSYFINMSGNNGMAVGGSGDVLSGILGGLMVQIMQLEKREEKEREEERKEVVWMAALAAYLHGKAGEIAKEKSNVYSMMADDMIEGLKDVLR